MAASGDDRTEKLRKVKVPALIVHAEKDPLVSLEAAQAMTEAFQNGNILILEGIGHGVPPKHYWPKLANAMHELAYMAEGK